MTPTYFITSEDAIQRHVAEWNENAARERAETLVRVVKAVMATIKALLSGAAPGGFHAAQ